MLEKWIRPFYQRRVIRILIPIFCRFFTPNQITWIGGSLGVIAGLLISLHYNLSATIFLLASGIFDSLDGSLARHISEESNWGCVIDVFTDRMVECAVILGLFSIDVFHRALPSMLMLTSIVLCITSFLVVGIFTPTQASEKSFHYSIGLIERFEAFVFFIAMIWFPIFFTTFAYLFAILVFLTAFIRLYQFKTQISDVNKI